MQVKSLPMNDKVNESQFEIQAEQKPRVNLHDPSRPILFTLGPEGGITQVEASFTGIGLYKLFTRVKDIKS